MRIWSIHPKYLDTKGLVALWRETLLAKNVLVGNTKGYKNHPQLLRFKESSNQVKNINFYLEIVWKEATEREYNFNADKFTIENNIERIAVTKGQIEYEFQHLLNKLKIRDIEKYNLYHDLKQIELHPLFYEIEGSVENWEKI